jgi:hypothetical protein
MKEREPRTHEYRWQETHEIGRLHLWGETYDLTLGLAGTQAPYGPSPDTELVPLRYTGLQTAVTGQAWIAEPRVTALAQWRRRTGQARPDAPVEDEIINVGNVHAVWYEPDRLLVLWICRLALPLSQAEPALDPNLRALWRGTKDTLLQRFPAAEQLVTPAWEPVYDRREYRAFLENLGYACVSPHAYRKLPGGR